MTDPERVLQCYAELPREPGYDRSRRLAARAKLLGAVVLFAFTIGAVSLMLGALESHRERTIREAIRTHADRLLDTAECPPPSPGALNTYAYFFTLAPDGKIIRRECARLTGPAGRPKPAKGTPA